jgi:predicted TIM-barrel fold metal-dependent hydrolase
MSLDVTGRYRYPPPDPAWLGLSEEEVLEPDLPIIDAHHHLWDEGGSLYLLDEYAADLTSGHRIVATVFAQAHYGYWQDGPEAFRPVGETERVAAIAAEAQQCGLCTRVAAGIVAHADLRLGQALDPVLAAHDEAARGALRGIRHSTARDPHFPDGIVIRPAAAGLLGDSGYRAGLHTLARNGLSYDAMLYHSQLGELIDMARDIPELPIILDHYGGLLGVGPYRGREQETFAAWRTDMVELAKCPNVVVKLGGLGMIICGPTWHERPVPPSSAELATAWRPYVETCVELFGAARCMFESNFPVDKAMYSYRTLWNAFKRLTAGASKGERAALFAGTAAATYRLPDDILPRG